MRKYVLVSLLLLSIFMVGQTATPAPAAYKLSELQQLKLANKQKDLVIFQQQIQQLQAQYAKVVEESANTSREYTELAEAIRKENKWDDAVFDPQTGTYIQKVPQATKK
jgi:peptidoglycan hydrolase CwlO-like protein